MLVRHCHLRIKITEDIAAETSPSKHSPHLLDRRAKKHVQLSNQQAGRGSQEHTLWLLQQPHSTSSYQIHSFHPGLDTTHRDGNDSLSG